MQLNKFKMLGAAAIIVAAGINVAHAGASYGSAEQPEPVQVQQVEQKSIFQSLKDALAQKVEPNQTEKTQMINQETSEIMNRPATQTYNSGKYGNINNVDDRMSNEDILIASTKHMKEPKKSKAEQKVNKGDVLLNPNEHPKQPEVATNPAPEVKPGDLLLKAWQGTKNVASTVAEKGKESILAAKARVDAENQKQAEAKIVRAEAPLPGQVTREDVIKAKDKVLDGMSSFLGKLRSEPKQENSNKNQPGK